MSDILIYKWKISLLTFLKPTGSVEIKQHQWISGVLINFFKTYRYTVISVLFLRKFILYRYFLKFWWPINSSKCKTTIIEIIIKHRKLKTLKYNNYTQYKMAHYWIFKPFPSRSLKFQLSTNIQSCLDFLCS